MERTHDVHPILRLGKKTWFTQGRRIHNDVLSTLQLRKRYNKNIRGD